MYNCNTDSLGLILGVEVFFFLRVTVQEHCVLLPASILKYDLPAADVRDAQERDRLQ